MFKRNKKILFLVGLVILAFYIYCIFPRNIEKNLVGIEYRLGDSSYKKEVLVTIEGQYSRKLFSSDYFEGSMTIGDVKLTQLQLYIKKSGEVLLGKKDGSSEYESYGAIYTKSRFEELTINIFEDEEKGKGSWNSKNGLMISAPAKNRDEALTLSNNLMKSILGKDTVLK
ncbi:hypothetical protein F8154_13335 [Alkaliphilus pronyensis]|uniref:Uncharacterized protein n=1 Tax=Alkaliphilus pronyensis TaxID=1482732 RepID=A0A6I0F6G0_9FIRM|nr:hypothetical protein [Alkaliphilus pronyensis]KAB3531053.1 hypothetical protein F8154_13335 [Alkaliphilus pronyensis]